MIVIYGFHRFRPRLLAFRNDYCLRCRAPKRSVQVRTFNFLHIFWIPLIPLGYGKRWVCATCRREPHVSRNKDRAVKWGYFAVLALFAFIFWSGPIPKDFVGGAWAIRIVTTLGALLVFVNLQRTPKDPKLKDMLATIPLATDTECPLCKIPLLVGSQTYCPQCGVQRA